jgi:hypothetical protein
MTGGHYFLKEQCKENYLAGMIRSFQKWNVDNLKIRVKK